MRKASKIIIALVLLGGLLSMSVYASSARLIGIDTDTRGDWTGNFGSEGYYIIGGAENIPPYAQVEFLDAYGDAPGFWVWWDSEIHDELEYYWRIPSALYKESGSSYRVAACYFAGNMTIVVDIGDETKKVSLYISDFDEGLRDSEISVFDADGNELLASFEAFAYEDGWYLQFVMSGRVYFQLDTLGGPNVAISGIFFDAYGESAEYIEPVEISDSEYIEPAPEQTAPTPAPQTFDPIVLIAVGAIVSAAIAKKKLT